ncbi:MAG TPA: hypothetical protein VGF03_18715 [Bryobacteraceae bacterium]
MTASSLALAQTPGWRHIGDAPPAPADQQEQAQDQTLPAASDQQNPEPVAQPNQEGQPAAAPATTPAPAPPSQAAPAAPRVSRPAYGLPAELTVKPGTYISVRINQALSTDHNQAGDPFTATLTQPLVVDGIVVAHRGQTVYGSVAEAQKQHSNKPSRLKLELNSFTLADGTQVTAQTQLVARQGGTTPAGVQAGTVAGTTVAGAAVGAAADWGTGAAIGGGAGAAAGIIGVLLTHNHPTVIYPETALTFQLTAPFTISTARAPQAFRYVGPDDYARPAMQMSAGPRRLAPSAYYGGPGYGYPYYYGNPYPYYSYPYWGPQWGFGAVILGGRGWGRWR